MIRIHNPHHLPFLRQTETFLQRGTLCDTVLMVDGHVFKAHALVLAWASKNLERQLTSQNPGLGYRCSVGNVSPQTLKQILDYVYSEWVEVPEGDLPELLRGAQHLEVQSLVEQCQVQMSVLEAEQRLSPDVNVGHCDSKARQKIPSSDEASPLSSSLDSPPVTHSDLSERSGHVSSPSPPPPPPPQKPSLPMALPEPPTAPSREVIFSSLSTSPTPTPPLHWSSLNPSRRMVLSYRDIMAVHTLRASQQMMACSYPTPMYPFFHRSIQPQVPSSLLGYSALVHPYNHLLRPRPLALDSPLVPGLKGKSDAITAALAGGEQDRERKPNVQSEKETLCRHCSKPAVENAWRQTSRSPPSGSEEYHGCKFCRSGMREKRSLRSLRRGLGGEKPYQCKHCSKRFSLKHQLDTHLRVHTGEKPFECRLCGQRSRDYSAMIKHLRTHGGATPYQCTLCLEFCSSLATMQKHLKSHPNQDFPPNWSLSSTYLYTCHT
ncbi:zinc finger and BTB domain-containing protein 32 [Astyanax mexicanus]|uniref:zinc finger and BTB domain-containing protein 32 n=1 Tax=Astyanax mexicanus TaxID=7994 RepID=UPI0020CB0784|nr:zinc finger and BTB domain-containing protein 32 [Astyanax mexicanus]